MNTPTARRGTDGGFSMVELLVVIIIIGILAAIAIPLYLNQQAKARDSAVQSDLASLATYVAAAASETEEVPTVTVTGGEYVVNGQKAFAVSPGVVFGGISGATAQTWCIDATHPNGDVAATEGYRYNAPDSLTAGQCP